MTGVPALAPVPPVKALGASLSPERQIVVSAPPPGSDDLDFGKYVEWITLSLREYEEVTVIGIDPALASCVSIILLLEESGAGVRQSLKTVTLQSSDKSPKSCIKALVRRSPTLSHELRQKEADGKRPQSRAKSNAK